MIDTTKICNVEVTNIDTDDYPDFCDAYISAAQWEDGTFLSEEELDELNEQGDFVYQAVLKHIY